MEGGGASLEKPNRNLHVQQEKNLCICGNNFLKKENSFINARNLLSPFIQNCGFFKHSYNIILLNSCNFLESFLEMLFHLLDEN